MQSEADSPSVWPLRIAATFVKEGGFPLHSLGSIPAGSFHILPALIFLTLPTRGSSIPALAAQLLLMLAP